MKNLKLSYTLCALFIVLSIGYYSPTLALSPCSSTPTIQCYEDGGYQEILSVMVCKDGLWGNSYGSSVVFKLANGNRYFINKGQKELTSLLLTAYNNGKKIQVAKDPNVFGPDGSVEAIMIYTEGY
jgi:hypothetical protein